MDPKVCGKLLTTHWRGYGVDVEALRGRSPLRRSAGEGSKMGSRGYRRLRRWNCVSLAPWMFSGYVGIYRRKKYIGGRPRGPQDRSPPLVGRAPCLMGPSGGHRCTSSSYIYLCTPKTTRGTTKHNFHRRNLLYP